MTLTLTSSAFQHNASIPSQFTCDAENISPPLSISGVPEGAMSLALLMDDPDIPQVFKQERGIDSFDHWTLFNIPPETTEIPQGGSVGTRGVNGAGKNEYTGPCPPREYEPSEHRYFFRVYALDMMLDLPPGTSKVDVLRAMEGHVLEQEEFVGKYKRVAL
ncbi:YbhB/YbcL family Raf kinase inhibitor-like protein [Candidatus Kaiserbacteria bacterium]|nr:YbhB/YbcL family Raf kinase inhibitor-like protein [Candidatus Kaiserbacteria bacterium]